jgi:hypothetical protein
MSLGEGWGGGDQRRKEARRRQLAVWSGASEVTEGARSCRVESSDMLVFFFCRLLGPRVDAGGNRPKQFDLGLLSS